MGNCLVSQENKTTRVIKPDGKILEYRASMKVHQLLSEFPGHAVADELPVIQHLQPDDDMLGGQLYYLLPLPIPTPKVVKKMVRFSNPIGEAGEGAKAVRIKLVVSKQELEGMLRKGGLSIDDLVSQLQKKEDKKESDELNGDANGNGHPKGWKPLLESIPEID